MNAEPKAAVLFSTALCNVTKKQSSRRSFTWECKMDFNRKVNQNDYTNPVPEYPARYLTMHCAVKGVQAGSILGIVLTPAVAFWRKMPILSVYSRVAPVAVVGGVSAAMGLLYYKYDQGVLDEAGVDDRAYRIANNSGQVTVDKYSFVGSLVGASVGAVVGRGGIRSIITATSTAVALSIAFYIAEKQGLVQQVKDFTKQKQQ